ncbi:MAG TPA: DUF5668 domain-containing protein [Mucilaginibacter sp.]|nr:DUF5668 domain-containing protein [Mucilaginibacter sp.]
MRNDKLVPGAILVCIGAIFLLNNFGYIDFHWMNVIHLWPIFLIMGGVNLVFANNKSAWATILKLGVVVLGFGLLLFGHFERYSFWPGAYNFHYNDDRDNNDNDDDEDSDSTSTDHGVVKIQGSSVFNKDYTADAKLARLNISGGGTTYTLNDTTSQLFKAETKEFYGKYEFNSTKEDSVYVLNLKMKNNKGWHFDSEDNKSNLADIKLNSNPVWDINVETGATKLDFDLSKFKIKNLTLKGGAASFDVKLGNPLVSTNVEVSTGVSEVNISVPKEAACSIRTNSGLSSNEFEGFDKKDNSLYETPGFDAAKNKIYIHMSGGVSDFKVNRY